MANPRVVPDTLEGVVESAQIWLNGEPAARTDAVVDGDEVAVLPPVSGGAG